MSPIPKRILCKGVPSRTRMLRRFVHGNKRLMLKTFKSKIKVASTFNMDELCIAKIPIFRSALRWNR